jgi:hypothetical protein
MESLSVASMHQYSQMLKTLADNLHFSTNGTPRRIALIFEQRIIRLQDNSFVCCASWQYHHLLELRKYCKLCQKRLRVILADNSALSTKN